jgi:hypothetical protein
MRSSSWRGLVAAALLAGGLFTPRLQAGEVVGGSAFATPRAQAEEKPLLRALEAYVKAIEAKDLVAFRAVKPNLTEAEERRAKKAFESLNSQAIAMTVTAADVQDATAVLKVSRRDTINGSIVSSFPQTFTLVRARAGWAIQEISGR